MLIYLPQSHALNVAEDATHTLHNLLPFRGTVVRDANRWSQYLHIALDQFGADVQVMIAQHTWPVWGNERVRTHLANQRDLYKYVYDQTIRMMNQGLGPTEIAEALTMPPGLENDWSAHGYYGMISHDSKAVYQRYIGWDDGRRKSCDSQSSAARRRGQKVSRGHGRIGCGDCVGARRLQGGAVPLGPSGKRTRPLRA